MYLTAAHVLEVIWAHTALLCWSRSELVLCARLEAQTDNGHNHCDVTHYHLRN